MIPALTSHYRAARGARLVRSEAGGQTSIDLTLAGVHIGRAHDCAIRTEDASVSRRHCKISFSGGRWCVDDLGSSNGTFVNGERVTRAALRHGDLIRCGSLEVRFCDAVESREAAPPTLALADGMAPPPAPDLRADNLRQRIGDLERREAQHEEETRVLTQLGQELRDALSRRDAELAEVKAQLTAAQDELVARDRQLERAREDVDAHRRTADEKSAELAAAVARAEEGWREIGRRDDELERMREIMRQQEHLLDERTVGLTALEAALQQLRAERERLLREGIAARQASESLAAELEAYRRA